MKPQKKSKKILILLAILVLLVVYLIMQSNKRSKDEEPIGLVSGTDNTGQALTGEESPLTNLLSLIQSISTVTLNGGIFTRSDFKYLRDLSLPSNIQASQYTGGRVNPFLPYDPISNGKLTQTQTSSPSPSVSVKTSQVQNIKATDATLGATISPASARQIYFEYGKSTASFDKKTSMIVTKEDGTATLQLTGLTPGTTYFVRAVINEVTNPIQGDIISFKTLAN